MLLKIAKDIFKVFQMINTRFDSKEGILVMVKTIVIPCVLSVGMLTFLLTEKQVKLVKFYLTKIDTHFKPDFFSFS